MARTTRLYRGTYVWCIKTGWFGVILDVIFPDEESPAREYRVSPVTDTRAWTDWYYDGEIRPASLLELIALSASGVEVEPAGAPGGRLGGALS